MLENLSLSEYLISNAVALQAIATILLMIITAWYAWSTYRMAKSVKMQLNESKQLSDAELNGQRASLCALIEYLVSIVRHFPCGEDLSPSYFKRAAQADANDLCEFIKLVAIIEPQQLNNARIATEGFYWFAYLSRNEGIAGHGSPERGKFPREEYIRRFEETSECLHKVHRKILVVSSDNSESKE
jgi:hypothetical protein